MAKDNVDLICDIGELAGLFERSRSLEDFLSTVVSIIAYHMRAAVCSVYLYDDVNNELFMAANQGLKSRVLGMRLKMGEGITGMALKELRPICEAYAHESPYYKYFPEITEERFMAFLAVPIVRGLNRVGVIVVQDPQPNYFGQNDIKALKAISAQLAATIENAKLLLEVHKKQHGKIEHQKPINFIKGKAASEGVVLGKVIVIGNDQYDVLTAFDDEQNPRTLDDFNRILEKTEQQLEDLQWHTDENLSDVASLIFNAHLLILKDIEFSGEMINLIKKGWSPQRAISHVVNEFINLFSSSKNPRLKEKVQDVKDLGHRLMHNLMDREDDPHVDYEEQIIIASDLHPSDIVKFVAQKAAGFVVLHGAATAHINILARSLQIPVIFTLDVRLLEVEEGTPIILDGTTGNIFLHPNKEIVEHYIKASEALKDQQKEEDIKEETYTSDGVRIKILSNINLLSDVNVAHQNKAEGIGLYRSEFPFIVRAEFPSEEEQLWIYRKLIDGIEGKEVVFRTLDIGGDKVLPYHEHDKEDNPFLGLRAIRFSLKNPPIFKQQIRAMLRATHDTYCKIMFPMISSVDEFMEAKEIVYSCIKKLSKENANYNKEPKLGAMVELPAAVEIIDELANEVDFFSIGTNDLIQYILAVDRTNKNVAQLYNAYHPAVLRILKKISESAARHNVELSICGDIVMDEKILPFLLGIGINIFSVDPRQIGRIQQRIQNLSLKEEQKFSQNLLNMGKISEITQYLEKK